MRPQESLSTDTHPILKIDVNAVSSALRVSDEGYLPAFDLAQRIKDTPGMEGIVETFGGQTGLDTSDGWTTGHKETQVWLRNDICIGMVAGYDLALSQRNPTSDPSPGLPFIVGGLKSKARAYAPGAIAAALAVMFSILCAGTGPSWKVFCCLLILAIFGAFVWRIASAHAKKSANVAAQPAAR